MIDASGARSATPSRSWSSTWEAITADGVLTLPDDSTLPNDGHYILDGVTYAVEVQRDGAYRAYSYGNPADHDWPEATSVLRIAHVLARAFRIRIDDRSRALQSLPPPNPYAYSACIGGDRVYLASSPQYDTLLVGDVAEMTDEMGLPAGAPLRTIAAWRAALR